MLVNIEEEEITMKTILLKKKKSSSVRGDLPAGEEWRTEGTRNTTALRECGIRRLAQMTDGDETINATKEVTE